MALSCALGELNTRHLRMLDVEQSCARRFAHTCHLFPVLHPVAASCLSRLPLTLPLNNSTLTLSLLPAHPTPPCTSYPTPLPSRHPAPHPPLIHKEASTHFTQSTHLV